MSAWEDNRPPRPQAAHTQTHRNRAETLVGKPENKIKTRIITFDPGCQQPVSEHPACSNSFPPQEQDALFPPCMVLSCSSPHAAEAPGTLQGSSGSIVEGQIFTCGQTLNSHSCKGAPLQLIGIRCHHYKETVCGNKGLGSV